MIIMDSNKELNSLVDTILSRSKDAGNPLKKKDIARAIELEPGTLTKILGGHQNANANHVARIKDAFKTILEKKKYTDEDLDTELLTIHSTLEVLLRTISQMQANPKASYSSDPSENLKKLKQEIGLVSVEREK